jgi:Na+/H+ antiporter NhaD/arsenite permease-like protein
MLIGSYAGIQYRDFLLHLGPVAVAGLFFDWLVLWGIFHRELAVVNTASAVVTIQTSNLQPSNLGKPVFVLVCVVLGFFLGAPPALASALGAATLLISRTTDSQTLYGEVDWGLLVLFTGLFLIVGGAQSAGIVGQFLKVGDHLNLHSSGAFVLMIVALGNLVSNVPAVMLLKSLVPAFPDPHRAWLLLAMASTLAGNLTITGSVANIIVVETAKPEMHIGFRQYFRAGLPVTVGTLLIGLAWLRLFP